MGQDPAGEGLQRIHRGGYLTAIDYNVDTEEYTYTVDGKEYTTTQDFSALFAMNVTVLAKDDEALLVRINKGGVVVMRQHWRYQRHGRQKRPLQHH